MVFSSNVFLFLFLPTFLGLYYLCGAHYRNLLLLIASYVFYAWWRVDFLALFAVVTLWNYWIGLKVGAAGVRNRSARHWLLLGVALDLAILGYFKYTNFGVDSFNALIATFGLQPFVISHILLPIGISFYIFESISYILAPDLLASLQQEKARDALFLRTDTHWTPYGAERVARHLARTVQCHARLSGEPQRFITEQAAGKPYLGDLVRFLPLDPLFSGLLPAPDQLQPRRTHSLASGRAGDSAALFADTRIPVVLVGTSYSAAPDWNFLGALRQALGSDILNYAENGQGPLLPMLKYLQTDAFRDSPPQLVIWEFPERYLPMAPDLSQFDPAWIDQLEADGATGQRLATQAR